MAIELLVCIKERMTDKPSCAGRGSKGLADLLEQEVARLGWPVPVTRIQCFGWCEQGPNIRIAPGGKVFQWVKESDLPAILAEVERVLAEEKG